VDQRGNDSDADPVRPGAAGDAVARVIAAPELELLLRCKWAGTDIIVRGQKLSLWWDQRSPSQVPRLLIRKYGSVVGSKIVAKYPLSEEGWRGAWEFLVREDTATAIELKSRLEVATPGARREREERGLSIGQLDRPSTVVGGYGSTAAGSTSPVRTLHRAFTVVGGYGWAPRAGTQVSVALGLDRLVIAPLPMASPLVLSYDDLLAFEFLGGARTKGGGYVGGGFGLKGAVEGMVVASILNGLTTKTKVNGFVRVSGREGEAVLHVPNCMPADLRSMFAPAVNAIAARRLDVQVQAPSAEAGSSEALPHAETDISTKLERLAALHNAGQLTDEEFAAAKRVLLAGW
jgi:hypothetical protein